MRIAVVGAGISGLVCAHVLSAQHDVTVFEAGDRLGGHTNTVRVDLADETYQVDTGFIVYNERNYPNFSRLLSNLEVATQPSQMSFSVSRPSTGFEYRATNLNTLYADRRNVLDPSFHRMLADIIRFNRAARRLLADPADARSLGEFIADGKYGRRLVADYLVPIGASIWSADPATFTDMPAFTFATFFNNHGLLAMKGQPQWRTITGGSARYVEAIMARFPGQVRLNAAIDKVVRGRDAVEIHGAGGWSDTFDQVVLATHSDEALGLLADPSPAETDVLGRLRYQANEAVLHTDRAMLPRLRRTWASWNYHLLDTERSTSPVTYWMNRLQRLSASRDICVTLNRSEDIDPASILATFEYAHPVLDGVAVAAQHRRAEIQGRERTWFCGAYWGYGFHEDGVRSALDVCRHFGMTLP